MKKKYQFDDDFFKKQIKDALTQECNNITLSPSIKDGIDERIRNNQEEVMNMKHFNLKKVAIGVAAACLLIPGGVYAAGHATALVSHSTLGAQYKSYDGDMGKAEDKLGYNVQTVEHFDNSYCFKEMEVLDVQGVDEDNNKLYTYKDMTIYYEKEECPRIYLDISRPVENDERTKTPNATKACGDITLYYDEYTYKSVPADYELTAEDENNEQRDDYYISVGSDEVEINLSQGVTWETADGTHYNLAGFDLGLSADEMFTMAEEIIENGQ